MRRPKVYVTRKILPPGIEMLGEHCDITVNPEERPVTKEELYDNSIGKDAILCMVSEKIDKDFFDAAPTIKVVSSYSVGFDHIDVKEATKRGIYVTHTPGVLTEATADLAWALLMAAARRVVEADKFLRAGKWKTWAPTLLVGEAVYGKTIGIVGAGRIGFAVAKRARGFNMRILYYDAVRMPAEKEKEVEAEFVTLKTLLEESDFVTIHAPLMKETYHLINEQRLRLMKKSAILINDARGPIVDQVALTKALKERWIQAAGLDVFEEEPIRSDDPLIQLDNVVLLPHIGSGTNESRSAMAELAARNIIDVFQGRSPPALANPEVMEWKPLSDMRLD